MTQLPKEIDTNTENSGHVQLLTVSHEEAGQRLDNWLLRHLHGVPKTRVYKAIRKGEVRVNKGRAKAELRLEGGDRVRLPPLRQAAARAPAMASSHWADRIRNAIVLDDGDLIVINKPTGLAVHGGSGVSAGLIETLRLIYPERKYLELVHRLDRDTSGLLLIAGRASVLRELHAQLRNDGIDKRYQALVAGRWAAHVSHVDAPLEKYALASGERLVKVAAGGRKARTEYRVLQRWHAATLIEAKPITGRTHQIRVHCRHAGHPILGDAKYSSDVADKLAASLNLNRLFLHAAGLRFTLGGEQLHLQAPLDAELQGACDALNKRQGS